MKHTTGGEGRRNLPFGTPLCPSNQAYVSTRTFEISRTFLTAKFKVMRPNLSLRVLEKTLIWTFTLKRARYVLV